MDYVIRDNISCILDVTGYVNCVHSKNYPLLYSQHGALTLIFEGHSKNHNGVPFSG